MVLYEKFIQLGFNTICFRIEFYRVYSQFFNNKRCLKFNLGATDKKSEILDLMKSLCIESQIS